MIVSSSFIQSGKARDVEFTTNPGSVQAAMYIHDITVIETSASQIYDVDVDWLDPPCPCLMKPKKCWLHYIATVENAKLYHVKHAMY